MAENTEEKAFLLDMALKVMVHKGGSDLHLSVGAPPKARINGELIPLDRTPLSNDMLKRAMRIATNSENWKKFEETKELDFAYELDSGARFRVNYLIQRGNVGAVFRTISSNIKSLEQLKMPSTVGRFADFPRGLVLVTGPTGSGKSTTLAAIVDLINRNRACHIVTIEDPIEYLHRHKKANIDQREVGADTLSFSEALKHVLRQDPDVILLGELRDLDTISTALTAAETGHLVLATLHTQDTVQSIDRITDVFPEGQQSQIRIQLAASLRGVLCQALVPTADHLGRVAATELMFVNSAIASMIRENNSKMIYSSLQAGKSEGMHSMDQSLAELVNSRKITYEAAMDAVHDKKTFDLIVNPSLVVG